MPPPDLEDIRTLSTRALHRAEYALSDLMFLATRIRFRPWKNWQIRWFIKKYGVDMAETPVQDFDGYPNFDSFFVRGLNPGARSWPAQDNAVCSPADGGLSEGGLIEKGQLVRAKTARLPVSTLLGESENEAARFESGSFFTVYLAPHNYHRVHMPLTGQLREMRYLPGRLFSVKPRTVRDVPDLFARNERTVCLFDTNFGAMAVVMVAAVFVGAIEHPWAGMVVPPRADRMFKRQYRRAHQHGPRLALGDEMGRFHMGSTVITLLQHHEVAFTRDASVGESVQVGNKVATCVSL